MGFLVPSLLGPVTADVKPTLLADEPWNWKWSGVTRRGALPSRSFREHQWP